MCWYIRYAFELLFQSTVCIHEKAVQHHCELPEPPVSFASCPKNEAKELCMLSPLAESIHRMITHPMLPSLKCDVHRCRFASHAPNRALDTSTDVRRTQPVMHTANKRFRNIAPPASAWLPGGRLARGRRSLFRIGLRAYSSCCWDHVWIRVRAETKFEPTILQY